MDLRNDGVVETEEDYEGIQQRTELMSQAAHLKIQEKKVSFAAEQLAFKMDVDDTGIFKSEQPDPITVSNARGKADRKNSGGRKRSTSGKRKSGIGKGVSHLNKGRPKPAAKPAGGAKAKPAAAWND